MMLGFVSRDIFCDRVPKTIRRSDTNYYITEYPENHHRISEKNIPCFGNDKEYGLTKYYPLYYF